MLLGCSTHKCIFLTGIARDAVSIFQNYLSHDAPYPVQITDDLRNQCMGECYPKVNCNHNQVIDCVK